MFDMSYLVHDFEAMKIRILNGGHQIVANAGEILSVPTIADCMAHAQISGFFGKVARTEIVPHVEPVPGMQPLDYVELIEKRFSNPKIVDTTRRVAFDGSSRHPGFVIPTLREGLAAGSRVSGLALAEAAWARMCAGTREDGSRIEANDPVWDSLQATALAARERPHVWIEQSLYYGDLARNPRFADAFDTWLRMIWTDGMSVALGTYLAGDAD